MGLGSRPVSGLRPPSLLFEAKLLNSLRFWGAKNGFGYRERKSLLFDSNSGRVAKSRAS